MGTVRVEDSVLLPASADEVWALVGDFTGVPAWQPHIAAAEIQPDGNRRLTFARGGHVVDRLISHDPEARTLTYGPLPPDGSESFGGGPLELGDLRATIAVTPESGGCAVHYTIQAQVADARADAARQSIAADIKSSLAGIAKKFPGEGGSTP